MAFEESKRVVTGDELQNVNTTITGLAESVEELEFFKPSLTPDTDDYAHATTDQAGRLIMGERWDGTVHIPHLEVDTLNGGGNDGGNGGESTRKILVVAGQSNAFWRFNSDGPVLAEPDGRVKWWNRISKTMIDVPASVTPSIGSAFARQYVEDNPGIELLIVPVTVGSTGFKTSSISPPPEGYLSSSGGTWDRTLTADPNNLAQRLFDSLAGALAATDNAEVLAMLWSQGENDRTRMTETTYAAAFDDFIGQIRTRTSRPDLPVVIGSMTPEEMANPQQDGTVGIISALEGTQARLTHTAYVWGPPNHLEYQQQIHWSPEGNRERGSRMATEGLRRARLNTAAGLPYSPRNPHATSAGGTATISWDYPMGRVTSFKLETSRDGTTWTTAALARPLATTHTMPFMGGMWARVYTVNENGTSYPTTPLQVLGTGDTGPRNIASLVNSAAATIGNITLRRTGSVVEMSLYDMKITTAAVALMLGPLPVGFRPAATRYYTLPAAIQGTAPNRSAAFSPSGNLSIYNTEVGDTFRNVLVFTTNDPWPTTMPGIPA